MKTISRETAREYGLQRFFTGNPCIHGHISERYVGNGACVECERLRNLGKKGNSNQEVEVDYVSVNVLGANKPKDNVDLYNQGRIEAFNEVLECIKWGNDIEDVGEFIEERLFGRKNEPKTGE